MGAKEGDGDVKVRRRGGVGGGREREGRSRGEMRGRRTICRESCESDFL